MKKGAREQIKIKVPPDRQEHAATITCMPATHTYAAAPDNSPPDSIPTTACDEANFTDANIVQHIYTL